MFTRRIRKKGPTVKESREFVHGAESFPYQLIRTDRRSTAIQIDPVGQVIVRAPHRLSKAHLEKILSEKAQWIISKRQFVEEQSLSTRAEEWPVLGELLSVQKGQGSNFSTSVDAFHVPVSWTQEKVCDCLNSYSKKKALSYLPLAYERCLERAGTLYPDILSTKPYLRLRKMKRSWGNCRGKRITLNTELYKYAPHLIDYVIYHELAHLIHANHGKGFYALQALLYPNWKSAKRELHQASVQYTQLYYSSQPKAI